MSSSPLYVAFVWHMHQPYYRNLATGECSMPWVRLHATKDYLDMLLRLEAFPGIHQTFNLVPSLLDQIEEYLPPHNRSDLFLDLSRRPAAELSSEEQRFLIQWFFLANIERMIQPYPGYHDLLAKRGLHVREEDWPAIQRRFTAQDYLDLQVWFNLAWMDPWLRSQDPRLAGLEGQGSRFTEAQKQNVLEAHLRMMARIIPAYRDAAARGQIELTTSPYYHPILPLLCDTRAAHDALPHLPLPDRTFRHPEDAQWHLRQALRRHQEAFGRTPSGVWPSEGGVSEAVVELAIAEGVRWLATDEAILWRTLRTGRTPAQLYRPHRLQRASGELRMLFRDRELSDLIGFVYSQWEPSSAAADFVKRLEAIRAGMPAEGSPGLVTIILDGENAWEYYPKDGQEFFMRLYEALAGDERFRCVTVSEFLERWPVDHTPSLPELASGSWIDGNLSTWIGHPEKNAAWGVLCDAREALGAPPREGEATGKTWSSLGVAEGSDWMWWFGDTHFSAQAEEFDRLFRAHVANAYQFAGLAPPEHLQQPIRRKIAQPMIEPTALLQPVIDGRETSYYEWLYAGRCDLKQQYGAAQRAGQWLRQLYYGFNQATFYFRIDVDQAALIQLPSWSIELSLTPQLAIRIDSVGSQVQARLLRKEQAAEAQALACAFDKVIELALPLKEMALQQTEKLSVAISLSHGGQVVERYPVEGTFELLTSVADLEARAWP